MKLAITGGTGFVGAHVIDVALESGHAVRALTRRDQPPRDGIAWVPGSLEDQSSLKQLTEGADAVIHVAGVINARDPAGFDAGNVAGTRRVLAAAGTRRFVHVSSLAAREPKLSQYGASKARAEALLETAQGACAIVRPPAVYGPGDRETLELFKMAKLGLMLLPPAGRLSMIHATDLARLLVALAEQAKVTGLFEPDDGRPGGWSHKELAVALGKAVGRRNLALSMPASMLRAGAAIDQFVRRERAKLSPDRAAYFSHRDWAARPACKPPSDLWSPQVPTDEGLAQTARWYEGQGWL